MSDQRAPGAYEVVQGPWVFRVVRVLGAAGS